MTAPSGSLFPANLDTGSNIGTSVSSGQLITAAYANTQSSAILALENTLGAVPGVGAWKPAVRLATAAALPSNTYSGGPQTLTAAANAALTVDGVSVATNDRILVKNESTQTNDGIYVVTQTGSGSQPYILTRAEDYNLSSSIPAASAVSVSEGTANTHTLWMLSTSGTITLDTSNLTYAQLTGSNLSYSTVQTGSGGGSANAYTLTVSPSPGAYAAGQVYLFSPTFANTGAATLNVNSLGAKSITKYGTNALVSGDIVSGQMLLLVYDGTQFQLISPGAIVPIANGGTAISSYTKGNLLAGTSSGVAALAVGSNNQVLTADSTQTTGMKWAAPKLGFEQGGTLESTEPNVNFIAGNTMSIAVSDNAGASRADITITNAGGTTVGGREAFLDGADGNVTFDGTSTVLGISPVSSTYTLNRTITPENMTVDTGVTVNTASFIVFVQQTLTHNGTIANNGNSGSGSTGGAGYNGLSGYVNVQTVGAGTGSGSNSANVGAITNSWGGAGGAGGNGNTTTGGTGGTITAPAAKNGGLSVPRMWGAWFAGAHLAQVPNAITYGGAAGAGGAGAGTAGGGGGAGGGWLIVCARTVTGSGTLSANGGNGANGTATNTGGGGGGGGGCVSLFYESLANTITVAANGGSGGASGGGGGHAGSAGSAGNVFTISCS